MQKVKADAVTSPALHLRDGFIKLFYLEFPTKDMILEPPPVAVEHPRFVRQYLWIKANRSFKEDRMAFQGQIVLPPDRAFELYLFLNDILLGKEVETFKLANENAVIFADKNVSKKGAVVLTVDSKKACGRFYLGYDEVMMLAKFLKNYAVLWFILTGTYPVIFQRFGNTIYILHPHTVFLNEKLRERIVDVLGAYLKASQQANNNSDGDSEQSEEQEKISPVFIKDYYALKYVITEKALFFTYPQDSIKLENQTIERFLYFVR